MFQACAPLHPRAVRDAGRVPWGVADERVQHDLRCWACEMGGLAAVSGGVVVYTVMGAGGRVLGKVRSLDYVAASIFRLVLVRLLYTPTTHSSY